MLLNNRKGPAKKLGLFRNRELDPTSEDAIRLDVGLGSMLCENSDVELACRISVSISSLLKPIALVTSVGGRQLRKQIPRVLGSGAFSHSLGFSDARKLGLISYNGHIEVNNSLLSAVLHEKLLLTEA